MPCYRTKDGVHICGNLGPHCRMCADVGTLLCDYPIGNGKTCDAPLCEEHAYEVAPDLHYCPAHRPEWERFSRSGGIRRVLENVVPFKQPKGAQ